MLSSNKLVLSLNHFLKFSAALIFINALHMMVMVATLNITFEVTSPAIRPNKARDAKKRLGKTRSMDLIF